MSTIVAVLVNLGQNMVLWFAALWIYRLVYPHRHAVPAHRSPLLLGALVGGLGLLGIAAPIGIASAGVVDGRMPLVVLVGAWAGPLAALAAGSLGAIQQLWLGGPSAPAGIGALLSGSALGALVWASWGRRRPLVGSMALLLLGIASAVVSLAWAFALSNDLAGLAQGALTMLIAYPLAALIFGAVFAHDLRRAAAEAEMAAHQQAEAALKESEERYARLADAAFEGIGFCENAIMFDANARLAEMLGYTREELIGMPTDQLVAPGSRDLVRRRLQTGYQGRYEHLALRKDGTVFPVEAQTRRAQYQGRAIRITAVRDISERTAAQQALIVSEARFRTIFEQATIGIVLVDMDGCPVETNPALQTMLGYTADELRAMTFLDFTHPEDVDAHLTLFDELAQGRRESYQLTKRYLHKNGQVVWGNLRLSLVRSAQGEPRFAIAMVEDITERKRIEAQYLQAQKMDAIGRLAGGVAHDFNNLLTVILGNCELLLDEIEPDQPICQDVTQIREAAKRAAGLTRQLLAFSRKQLLNPTRLDLNSVVANVEALLRRLIGEDIVLISRLDADLSAVQADPGQIEQVIMNLAVNARDAMPIGGTLIIETANVMLDASYGPVPGEVASGPYSMLAVSDTGCGMDVATQAQIFEPFFSTKAPSKGTGLGLATVYGIVQQSGGHIWVYSEPGHGTTFKIYLPQAAVSADEATPVAQPTDQMPAPQDTGTVLLIEDEPLVRALASRVLQAQGYRVLEAGDGVEALRVAAQVEPIDVLLTDVIIPGGMSGPQVAQQARIRHPDLQVLYMSGYTDAAIAQHAQLDPGQALLQKPFTLNGLAHAVWNARRTQDQPVAAEGMSDRQ